MGQTPAQRSAAYRARLISRAEAAETRADQAERELSAKQALCLELLARADARCAELTRANHDLLARIRELGG
jgi:hypothetical protein